MSEPAVMSILKPVIINDELPRTTAMARVLACSAGYDASEIRSLGLEKKLTDDVIAEAVYIPMPEIPF
jgi:hypothetical protein